MSTFLLFLRTLGLLLRAAAAVGAIGHGETPIVKVAVNIGFIFVTLTERQRQREDIENERNTCYQYSDLRIV